VVAALYRRYRPETFAELIGQSQVTDPLRAALRSDRVGHAYLFSGPRGCGKTTSARILARCLNCAEGPTDTPCGTCPSCIELGRGGGGSLDVVEIDAASHNGVDDARDLRERAVFAPARDRFKIFILDEAHMVTPQGFNALLKIVEEPPEHVKFIFATTEPEKVIGTIRSRTHHYPFRLVPPAQLLEYVEGLCAQEGVAVEPGVLPLVVRAGGGSVRDTLSLLDQLIAGSDDATVRYERAVALLGYTHGALLDDVVDALGARDAAAVFAAVDRVIQTGQDPRRFVEDLLERLRDLVIVAASPTGAASILRGVPQDQLDAMTRQASAFGQAELSRAADIANAALTEMTGATSPRLHLELLAARLLVPAADESPRGALARVERLERRIGVDAPPVAEQPAPPAAERAQRVTPVAERAGRVDGPPAAEQPTPTVVERAEPAPPAAERAQRVTPAAERAQRDETPPPNPTPLTADQLRHAWPQVLSVLERAKRTAWLVATNATVRGFDGEVLALGFPTQGDVEAFRRPLGPGESVSEHLRAAILEVLGVRVKFIAKADGGPASQSVQVVTEALPVADRPAPPSERERPAPRPVESQPPVEAEDPAPEDPGAVLDWEVAPIPGSGVAPSEPARSAVPAPPVPGRAAVPAPPEPSPPVSAPERGPRYGEAVVRELLGAKFIEEQPLPRAAAPEPPPPPDEP